MSEPNAPDPESVRLVTYAKASTEDILVELEIVNRGPDVAEVHVLPTLWFRNTWSWGLDARKPRAREAEGPRGTAAVSITHLAYGDRTLYAEGEPELLFTENDGPCVKDAFHDRVVHGVTEAVNPAGFGTKERSGKPDRRFLERVFHKLLLNFTWRVNRKDGWACTA